MNEKEDFYKKPFMYVGYIRVSTEEQAESGLSLQHQRERILAMAVAHGKTLSEIIEDAGVTGSKLARPGMARLRAACAAGEVETVYVLKLDRLTRSIRDLFTLLDDFAASKTGLVSVTESLDTGTATGRFFIGIMGLISQWERETISERTRAAASVKKANGERWGTVPYGMMGKSTLLPNPAECAIICKILVGRNRGESFNEIASGLNDVGETTRSGGPWHAQDVHRVWKAQQGGAKIK